MTYMATSNISTQALGIMKLIIVLVIITLYLVCLIYAWALRRFLKKKYAFLLYDLYDHALTQEPLAAQGVIKVSILVDSSLVIITIYLVCHEIYNFGRPFLGYHYDILCLIYARE